jgi:hypothetical protein
MKPKTIFILIFLGLIILASLCMYENHSLEGLNIMKKNTHVLHRGEYMDDVGYLKSEGASYLLKLRNGRLMCMRNYNGRWRQHWIMDTQGSKIMLLNDYGMLQFKSSKNSEYIPITKSKDANSLILTAYGTLELKSNADGNGETLWTYPVTEGLDNADNSAVSLMAEVDDDNANLTKHVVSKMNAFITDSNSDSINAKVRDAIKTDWNTFRDNVYNSPPADDFNKVDVGNYSNLNDDIIADGNHDTLLENARKLKRLRGSLDNQIKGLNALGGSHVSEKQIHTESTIYISLAWTAIASSLIYYTFTY